MLKHVSIGLLIFFCFANCLANATAINKQPNEAMINAQELSTPVVESSALPYTLFYTKPENDLWTKNALGDDFHRFFIKKIKNKKRKPNTLKMDFNLRSLSKMTTNTNKSQIETLNVPEVQFSEDTYQWNPANVSLMKLGKDYQLFIESEVSTGQTYKEFWSGEETTAFEDFIDEYFSFHDSALIRYLILLVGIFFVILSYLFREKLMQYMHTD